VDVDEPIIRKGAVQLFEDTYALIALNMGAGMLLVKGKFHSNLYDWNYSAPHGAGRVSSRTQAKKNISMDEYRDSMAHVWTTSVNEATLDEAPQAYKNPKEIYTHIKEIANIVEEIIPIYNIKSDQ